ncbi:helix-hairpin-helix domain-containing protein [Microvirga sp. BT689]|uniref:ComEA family DNA-binding protein n=1 Tax=Microvirga arvi TaxID=2778731 RepID=UPI00194DE96C|nr:helix-hairpin-helix domain-containing protein [Microvirga arvi]MBM6578960.1 helix-hairpin-helix domain-containing protein [Microvirga arvi]
MQIGNLSRTRTPHEQRDSAVQQAMRVLLVIGFMAGGSMVLWHSGGAGSPTGGIVTAAPPQILTGSVQTVQLPARRVRVADADPAAPIRALSAPSNAAYVPASGPDETAGVPTVLSPASPAIEQASAALQQAEAALARSARPVSPPPADMNMTGAVTKQASLAEPVSTTRLSAALVDLNRASVEQLNSLKGAGSLGRAIIRGRPYKSADDLVKKMVVRRTVYERIKDQVTVQ